MKHLITVDVALGAFCITACRKADTLDLGFVALVAAAMDALPASQLLLDPDAQTQQLPMLQGHRQEPALRTAPRG